MDENGEWRRVHNMELNSLYCSPNIIRVIKSITLRWAGSVENLKEVDVISENWFQLTMDRDYRGANHLNGLKFIICFVKSVLIIVI